MGKDTGKKYHEKATGAALETAEQHSKPADTGIVLFGSCFCPFVQRVWVGVYHMVMRRDRGGEHSLHFTKVAFEHLGISYEVSL
jgi:hypothetical protein